ncbi:MAG: HlyC/CorC family transporter [Chloroflexi bacterium]|nr:HlyC/CorC family transporter [Chloroflexota bacterium]
MNSIAIEILIIFLLFIANGVFAMSEIAIISARKLRLQQRAQEGNTGARMALDLANAPNNFLSALQIGITLIGILAGAFSGATLAERLTAQFNRIEFIAPYSEGLAILIVAIVITYLSLVIGELVPKRLALNNPEQIASILAPLITGISRMTHPIVHLLNLSTDALLRLLGTRKSAEPAVTEDEIRLIIDQGTQVGVLEPTEQKMVERVFRLDDRKVNSLMTPRLEIVWLDVNDPLELNLKKIMSSGHSTFPVGLANLDVVFGLLNAKDLLASSLSGQPTDLQALAKPALFVPESMTVLDLLEQFKSSHTHSALVTDEYGGTQGLVTINNIMESIVGDLPITGQPATPEVVQRSDGSWLVDGMLLIDEFKELVKLDELPDEEQYHTVGGLVITCLGRIPIAGDYFELGSVRLEVVDMDERRVDKVLVIPESSSTARAQTHA